MVLDEYRDNPKWDKDKDQGPYRRSILMPVAPEWTTGEVLLAAAYRKLLLAVQDKDVDRASIREFLPTALSPSLMWKELLLDYGGLASPAPAREKLGLPQIMPIVPETARYTGVLGRQRNRWEPGNLLLATLKSGTVSDALPGVLADLRGALAVGVDDDVLARYIEQELAKVSAVGQGAPTDEELGRIVAAWRPRTNGPRTPAERFVDDLTSVIQTKLSLTRRQWTVLMEAILRLGLGMHMLWTCRLNAALWELLIQATERGIRAEKERLEESCWAGHATGDPLLELGRDLIPMVKSRIQSYMQGRMGVNLVLAALEDCGSPWKGQIGAADDARSPIDGLCSFVDHVANYASDVRSQLQRNFGTVSLRHIVGTLADANPALMRCDAGITKNLYEFFSYTLRQLNTAGPSTNPYDQAYVASRQKRATVQPGPATLMVIVHACCVAQLPAPASMDDLRAHLLEYGINAPVGELNGGTTGISLEALGLTVDSPDAGGGRLLVDPF